MPKQYLKFTGKFSDLIPSGWKFGKAFARNYRYYAFHVGDSYSDNIRVWQHLGGYVEIEDFFTDKSVLVLEAVLAGRAEQKGINNPYHRSGSTSIRFCYNKKTNILHDYDFKKTSMGCAIELFKECDKKQQETGDERAMEPYLAARDAYYEEWEEIGIGDDMVEFLKDMVQNGLIDIVDDNRPQR